MKIKRALMPSLSRVKGCKGLYTLIRGIVKLNNDETSLFIPVRKALV